MYKWSEFMLWSGHRDEKSQPKILMVKYLTAKKFPIYSIWSGAINTFIFYLEVGLEAPQLLQELEGKRFWKQSISSGDGAEKKYRNKAEMHEKSQESYSNTERCQHPLWPPMQCTCIPSSLCCLHNKPNYGYKCIALEAKAGIVL